MKRNQFAAIRINLIRGRELARFHPEIRDMYLGGKTQPEISKYLAGIGINEPRLKERVGCALRGNEGNYGIAPYAGLLSKAELEETAKIHNIQSGNRAVVNQTGAHGLTLDKRMDSIRSAVRKRGDSLWDENYSEETGMGEDAYLAGILLTKSLFHSSGQHEGRPNWKEITMEVNSKYNGLRDERSREAIYLKGKQILGNPFLKLMVR